MGRIGGLALNKQLPRCVCVSLWAVICMAGVGAWRVWGALLRRLLETGSSMWCLVVGLDGPAVQQLPFWSAATLTSRASGYISVTFLFIGTNVEFQIVFMWRAWGPRWYDLHTFPKKKRRRAKDN